MCVYGCLRLSGSQSDGIIMYLEIAWSTAGCACALNEALGPRLARAHTHSLPAFPSGVRVQLYDSFHILFAHELMMMMICVEDPKWLLKSKLLIDATLPPLRVPSRGCDLSE